MFLSSEDKPATIPVFAESPSHNIKCDESEILFKLLTELLVLSPAYVGRFLDSDNTEPLIDSWLCPTLVHQTDPQLFIALMDASSKRVVDRIGKRMVALWSAPLLKGLGSIMSDIVQRVDFRNDPEYLVPLIKGIEARLGDSELEQEGLRVLELLPVASDEVEVEESSSFADSNIGLSSVDACLSLLTDPHYDRPCATISDFVSGSTIGNSSNVHRGLKMLCDLLEERREEVLLAGKDLVQALVRIGHDDMMVSKALGGLIAMELGEGGSSKRRVMNEVASIVSSNRFDAATLIRGVVEAARSLRGEIEDWTAGLAPVIQKEVRLLSLKDMTELGVKTVRFRKSKSVTPVSNLLYSNLHRLEHLIQLVARSTESISVRRSASEALNTLVYLSTM